MRKALGWAPAFVAGFGAGASGMVAVALLLYSGEGMLRSLAVIVATAFGAFSLGLGAGGPASEWNRALESLRRRWLFVLVTFLAAAGFTVVWAFYAGFGASGVTQALGLALLAGLPLYACGRLLGDINAVRMIAGLTGDGAMASLGAAAGVLVSGLGALPRVDAPSFVLFLIVILSGTARLQGWVLRPIEERVGAAEFTASDPSEALSSEALSPETLSSDVVDLEPPDSEAFESQAPNSAGPEKP